jgi:hypothetical protein
MGCVGGLVCHIKQETKRKKEGGGERLPERRSQKTPPGRAQSQVNAYLVKKEGGV